MCQHTNSFRKPLVCNKGRPTLVMITSLIYKVYVGFKFNFGFWKN